MPYYNFGIVDGERTRCFVKFVWFITEELYENTNNIITFCKLKLDHNCMKYTISLGILVIINVHPI